MREASRPRHGSADQQHAAGRAAGDPLGVRADQEIAGLGAVRRHHDEVRASPAATRRISLYTDRKRRSGAQAPRLTRARARTPRARSWPWAPAAPRSRMPACISAGTATSGTTVIACSRAPDVFAWSSATGSASRRESICSRSTVNRMSLNTAPLPSGESSIEPAALGRRCAAIGLMGRRPRRRRPASLLSHGLLRYRKCFMISSGRRPPTT